ncbi:unnamed protein product, partial [Gulo gulo]
PASAKSGAGGPRFEVVRVGGLPPPPPPQTLAPRPPQGRIRAGGGADVQGLTAGSPAPHQPLPSDRGLGLRRSALWKLAPQRCGA